MGWRNRKTGKAPQFKAMRGNTKRSDNNLIKHFNQTMPDGARGFLTNAWLTKNEWRAKKKPAAFDGS